MKEIETTRLILRHITIDDADDIFEYSQNQNVGPAAGWSPHTSIEETRTIMEQLFIGQDNIFGIVLKETKKLIGTIGLIKDPRRDNPEALMLGYAIGEPYWGKGIMTEAAKAVINAAFNEIPVNVISCSCYTTNARSRRVIEKCGFEYEGCIRQAEKRFDGKIMDIQCFSIIR